MIDLASARTRGAVFWATCAVMMVMDARLPAAVVTRGEYVVGTGLVLIGALVWWFSADARSLNVRPAWGLRLAVLVLPPLAVPYYRFRYAGFRNGLRFTALVVALFIALIAAVAIAFGPAGRTQ